MRVGFLQVPSSRQKLHYTFLVLVIYTQITLLFLVPKNSYLLHYTILHGSAHILSGGRDADDFITLINQSEKITSFAPLRIKYRRSPNYMTLLVPTRISYELHEIALHFLTR